MPLKTKPKTNIKNRVGPYNCLNITIINTTQFSHFNLTKLPKCDVSVKKRKRGARFETNPISDDCLFTDIMTI